MRVILQESQAFMVVIMEYCDLGSLLRAISKKAFRPHGKWSYVTTYVSMRMPSRHACLCGRSGCVALLQCFSHIYQRRSIMLPDRQPIETWLHLDFVHVSMLPSSAVFLDLVSVLCFNSQDIS